MIAPDLSPFSESIRSTRTTLKDIAAATNLSIASVSMALRNSPNVSQATIARVKSCADRLGYVPDPTLAALAAYRKGLSSPPISTTIALVTSWESEDGWTRQKNAVDFMAAARARAHDLGYSLQLMWARDRGIKPGRFDQILQARGIRGLILAPFETRSSQLSLNWDDYSVIALEQPPKDYPFDFVEPDQFRALTTCWEKIAARGYQRVGLIVDEHFTSKWDHRWEASHAQMQFRYAARSERIPSLTVDGRNPLGHIRAWISKYRPDVLIVRSVHVAAALANDNISLPRDLGYVSLNVADDLPGASGIAQPFGILGSTAVDLLHKRLLANDRGKSSVPLATQVCGTWHEGKSLPQSVRGKALGVTAHDSHSERTVRVA